MEAKVPAPVDQVKHPERLVRALAFLGGFQERLLILSMGVLVIVTAGVLLLLFRHSKDVDQLHRDLIVAVAVYGVGLLALAFVIRRLRQTKATLQREHDLLHALMDNLPDSIYFKDPESRFLRINRSLAERFGRRAGIAEGQRSRRSRQSSQE